MKAKDTNIVYMVIERNLNLPDEYGVPSKIFTTRESAELHAVLEEHKAFVEYNLGKTTILYSYVVEPWIIHE